MAAHSACDFGGGKAERLALAKYRQVIWQGRVVNTEFREWRLRFMGRCPLTPEEIGLLLAALGFSNNTRLYLASHKVLVKFISGGINQIFYFITYSLMIKWFVRFRQEIKLRIFFQVYGGEARISTLRKLFPLMEDKRGLSSAEERARVDGKASLLAAVDYYVSLHSDIFISASKGNMHNALVRMKSDNQYTR